MSIPDVCDCGGYYDAETGTVGHDGYCPLTDWDDPEFVALRACVRADTAARFKARLDELAALGVTIS